MRTAKTLIRADLSLRWAHTHFVGFVMSRLILGLDVRLVLVLVSVPCSIVIPSFGEERAH